MWGKIGRGQWSGDRGEGERSNRGIERERDV